MDTQEILNLLSRYQGIYTSGEVLMALAYHKDGWRCFLIKVFFPFQKKEEKVQTLLELDNLRVVHWIMSIERFRDFYINDLSGRSISLDGFSIILPASPESHLRVLPSSKISYEFGEEWPAVVQDIWFRSDDNMVPSSLYEQLNDALKVHTTPYRSFSNAIDELFSYRGAKKWGGNQRPSGVLLMPFPLRIEQSSLDTKKLSICVRAHNLLRLQEVFLTFIGENNKFYSALNSFPVSQEDIWRLITVEIPLSKADDEGEVNVGLNGFKHPIDSWRVIQGIYPTQDNVFLKIVENWGLLHRLDRKTNLQNQELEEPIHQLLTAGGFFTFWFPGKDAPDVIAVSPDLSVCLTIHASRDFTSDDVDKLLQHTQDMKQLMPDSRIIPVFWTGRSLENLDSTKTSEYVGRQMPFPRMQSRFLFGRNQLSELKMFLGEPRHWRDT
jgi:hypothetical protein